VQFPHADSAAVAVAYSAGVGASAAAEDAVVQATHS